MISAERHLLWFMRASAIMFLAAAPAVVMPTSWMRSIATALDVELPDAPLVEYLARSVSALYVTMGASYWYMSCDVRRYLPLLRFMVPVMVAFDVTAIALDLLIPMPMMWTAGEAVSIIVWTAALWWLVRRVDKELI